MIYSAVPNKHELLKPRSAYRRKFSFRLLWFRVFLRQKLHT